MGTDESTGGLKRHLWTLIAVAGPPILFAVATQFFAWALRIVPPTPLQPWLFLISVVLFVAAAAILWRAKVLESSKKDRLETEIDELTVKNRNLDDDLAAARSATDNAVRKAVDDATKSQLQNLYNEMVTLVSTTAWLALQPAEQRRLFLETLGMHAATALSSIVVNRGGTGQPRAVVYALEVDPAGAYQMKPIGAKGRGQRPGPFRPGTARGDAALSFVSDAVERRTFAFYPDLRKKKPEGYDGSMADYATFIAAPIYTENGAYGMVTLDAPQAKSLDEGDVALTRLFAELMAIVFEIAQDADSPEPETAFDAA